MPGMFSSAQNIGIVLLLMFFFVLPIVFYVRRAHIRPHFRLEISRDNVNLTGDAEYTGEVAVQSIYDILEELELGGIWFVFSGRFVKGGGVVLKMEEIGTRSPGDTVRIDIKHTEERIIEVMKRFHPELRSKDGAE